MKTKTPRTIRLIRTPTEDRSGKLVITDDSKATTYLLTAVASEIGGKAFQLAKVEAKASEGQTDLRVAERYDVLVNGPGSTCSCKWGTYGSHKKPCRHVASLKVLIALGKLS